ncbi:MAG: DUF547 domain-containing protein [Kiloniellales bacterium]
MNRPLGTVVSLGLHAALLLALALPLGAASSIEALFAPRADLWERWTAHDSVSSASIDHAAWDRFLKTYLSKDKDGVNRFAYARITDADRRVLKDYIGGLTRRSISRYNRSEQLAYWINLYNALTVKVVLDHYTVKSIRDIDISPGWFSDGPWDKKLITVENESLSLNDIEHRILRPIWRDARIHYAVNCAAIGCPSLRPMAFTAVGADDMLSSAAREYINHPRGARFEDGRLIVSSIYVWFQEDFGDSDAGVIAHLKRYASPELQAKLAQTERIDSHEYDWGLNDTPSP